MVGYSTSRFAAAITIRVPEGYTVIGSGEQGKPVEYRRRQDGIQLRLEQARIPRHHHRGQIPASRQSDREMSASTPPRRTKSRPRITRRPPHRSTTFSPTPLVPLPPHSSTSSSCRMTLSPPPGDRRSPPSPAPASASETTTACWQTPSPTSGGAMTSARLTLNDSWIPNGMSRYAEAMYIEHVAGKSGLSEIIRDISAGALAYDTIPLSSVSPARSLLSRISIPHPRQRRDGLPHAPLGDGR